MTASTDATDVEFSAAQRDEREAVRLASTGRFRILRRLQPRPVRPEAAPVAGDGRRVGILLDTETTGLDHAVDEVVELAMIAFVYDDDGVGDIFSTFEGLRQPRCPLSSDVRRLTGLDDAMLHGKTLDVGGGGTFRRRREHRSRAQRPVR